MVCVCLPASRAASPIKDSGFGYRKCFMTEEKYKGEGGFTVKYNDNNLEMT